MGAQRMLLRLGIASSIYEDRRAADTATLPNGKGGSRAYAIQPQHELIITGENLSRFADEIGFVHTDKRGRLEAALASYRRQLNRERFVARVTSIETASTEAVYDVQVPG